MVCKGLCTRITSQQMFIMLFGLLFLISVDGQCGVIDISGESLNSNIFIISIGINKYKVQPLQYACADAVDLSATMEKIHSGGKVHKNVLLDEKANLQSIASAFREVASMSRPSDLFIFHFSGYHGFEEAEAQEPRGEFYLLTGKVKPGETSRKILSANAVSAIRLKAWISRIPARRQLIILDTCHAGGVVNDFQELIRSEGELALDLSGRQIMILAPQGLTFESPKLGHGWLTFNLLKGLSGEADVRPDGVITAGELDLYLRKKALESDSEPRIQMASAQIGSDFVIIGQKDYRGVKPVAEPDKTIEPKDELSGKDYALLIATNKYDSDSWKELRNPVNDARAIAEDLRTIYGFETELIEDPTRDQFLDALRKYRNKKYGANDQLLIFIAGHGSYCEDLNAGYLVAKDTKSLFEDRNRNSFLEYDTISKAVDNIPIRNLFIIIDACFSGTFDRRIAESGHRGEDDYPELTAQEFKARKAKFKSRLYLTSGGKEYVPDGRPGQHSPFARKLLEALRTYGGKEGYLSYVKIRHYVEKVMPEPYAGEFGNSEPGGDFVLIKK